MIRPFQDRVARLGGLGAAFLFLLLYLYSVGNIVVAPGSDLAFGRPVPAILIAPEWPGKILKPIAPFVWEPIAGVYLFRSLALFLSVPNFLLALLLGALVGLNTGVALALARLVEIPKRGSLLGGLLPSLPVLLTGFTCCAPTLALGLGSLAAGFAVAAAAVAPYFLPAAIVALAVNLRWSWRRLSCAARPGN